MVVYDCAFGNNDRHDENWSIARDVSTNNLRLYPAYDNERVLGLYENQDLIKNSVDKNNVQDVSKSLLTSRIGIPGHPEKVTYDIMLQYLSEHYPEETLEFMTGIVQNVSEEDISSILSNLEGLPSEYIEFGTSTYSDRKKTMEKLIDKIKSKKREESISL